MWAVSNLWSHIVGEEEEPQPPAPSSSTKTTTTTATTTAPPPMPPQLTEWRSWQSPAYPPKLRLSKSEKRTIGKRLVRSVQTWYGTYRKRLLFDAFDTKRKGYVTALDILDNVERFNLVKSRRDFVGRLRRAGVTKEMRLKFRAFVSFAETHLSPLILEKRDSFWEHVSYRAGDVQLALQKIDMDDGLLRCCLGPARRQFIIKYPISRELKSGTSSQLRFEAVESESMRRICNEVNEFLRHRTYSTRESALVVALDEITVRYAETFSIEDRALRYKRIHGAHSSLVKNTADVLPSPLNLSRKPTTELKRTGVNVSRARKQIVDEVFDMMSRPRKGIEVIPDEIDPFTINVRFKDFPKNSVLGKSLREHEMKYDSSNALELRIRFKDDYPTRPPRIFLVSPILENGTGGVDNGFLLLSSLFEWRPRPKKNRLSDLLIDARNLVLREHGTVNLKTNCTYDENAFESVYQRYVTRPSIIRGVVSYLDRTYDVISESDLRAMKGSAISLQHGNKVLLPGDDFLNFQKRAQQRGDDHFIGDNAMTFEIEVLDGKLRGTKSYCGVLQWSAPPGKIVVPDSMVRCFGGHSRRVRVRHSALPQVNKVTLMPHDPEVLKEINESGIGTRAFLELSVSGNVNSGGGRGYTTLQIGQNVSLKAGKHVVEATVTSLKPDVPAVTLWSDFSSEMPLEFLEARNRVVLDKTMEEKEETVVEEKVSSENTTHKVIKKSVKNLDRKLAVKVTISDRIVVRANRKTSMSEIYDLVAHFGNVKDPSFQLMRGDCKVQMSDTIDMFLDKRKRHLRLDLRERYSEDEEKEEEKDAVLITPGVQLGEPTARVRVALCFVGESMPMEVLINLSQHVDVLEKLISNASLLRTHGLSSRLKHGDKILRPDISLQEQGIRDGSLIYEVVKPLTKCDVCLKEDNLRTFVVNWKCLGLCEEHRCDWLERLMQDGDYKEADMKMLTRALVMANLKSGVLM